MPTSIHPFIHPSIHTYIHTCIQTYHIHVISWLFWTFWIFAQSSDHTRFGWTPKLRWCARRCNTLSPVYALLHTWYGSESFGLTHTITTVTALKWPILYMGLLGLPNFEPYPCLSLAFFQINLWKPWKSMAWKLLKAWKPDAKRAARARRWWWELGLRPQICPNQDGISKKRFSLDCYWICRRNICLFPTRTMTFRYQTSGVSPTSG